MTKPLRVSPTTAILFCLTLAAPGFSQRAATLESALQAAVAAFSGGDPAQAMEHFETLERDFGKEPEYRAASVQSSLLPLKGYTLLMMQRPAEAAAEFGHFLREFPDNRKHRAFVLYALAQALQHSGDEVGAIDTFSQFSKDYPHAPEASVARLTMAEIRRSRDELPEALVVLRDLYEDATAPFTFRQQARLRALQLTLESGRVDQAGQLLLEKSWAVESIPERSALAFSALKIGDALLTTGDATNALAAYRMVPDWETLKALHQDSLATTRSRFAARRGHPGARNQSALWIEYYQNLIARLERQLDQLESMPDYTPSFLLRYGMAYLREERTREAILVFSLLCQDSWPIDTRQEAHYRLIVALQARDAWDQALKEADRFLSLYPESPQAPETLFLIANAYQQLNRSGDAVAVLDQLVETFPEHRLWGRWLFARGFNYLVLDAHSAARKDFKAFIDRAPDSALSANAALWHALAWLFENAHAESLEELMALSARLPPDHYLSTEVRYRMAAAAYGLRNYERALDEVSIYLNLYPSSSYINEVLTLKGDILMGTGQLDQAIAAFKQVSPEDERLFSYGIFQIGKIYRSKEAWDSMAAHYLEYTRRDMSVHPRLGEALHWLGWAYLQQDRLQEALPVLTEALDRFGNDRTQNDIQAILGSLHRAQERLARESPQSDSLESFVGWLTHEADKATLENRMTYRARLDLYRANRLRTEGRGAEADAVVIGILEQTKPSDLGPEEMGTVGLRLAELGFLTARDYLEALLEEFPASPHRALAYLGLAHQAMQEDDPEEAIRRAGQLVADFPAHPRAVEGRLLLGDALIADRRFETATDVLEETLRLREARGRPHAEALTRLARVMEATNRPERAIAYHQRVYNMYRGYPDLVARAYRESARLFEAREDLPAAHRTWTEFAEFAEAHLPEAKGEAQRAAASLFPLLPMADTLKPTAGEGTTPEG